MSITAPETRESTGRASASTSQRHRNPAIERMAIIFMELEHAPNGLDLASVTQRSGVARSSAYRILNSLEHHGFIRRGGNGAYFLGHRLYALGEAVSVSFRAGLLLDLLRDWMKDLALATGETVRLSAQDRGTMLLIGASTPPTSHALSAEIGQRLPIHAGGASKVLLAHMPEDERQRLVSGGLEAFTHRTITDPRALERELDQIRARGWALDPGEFSARVQSCAMPLRRGDGTVAAAISVAYSANDSTDIHDKILEALQNGVPQAEKLIAGI